MKKRLLDYDRASRTATYHGYDHDERKTYIETVQDVEPYLRANKAEMNMVDGGSLGLNDRSREQIKKGWWHVARIPAVVQHRWLLEYGVNIYKAEHQAEVRKLLNNPEWAYLRNNPGKV